MQRAAFLKFVRLLFKIVVGIFSQIIFSSSANITENLAEFCCVFLKVDHFTCNEISKCQVAFHCCRETRIILLAKWFNFENIKQNSTKFSEVSAENEDIIQEKKIIIATEQINQRLLPAFGETDCIDRYLLCEGHVKKKG